MMQFCHIDEAIKATGVIMLCIIKTEHFISNISSCLMMCINGLSISLPWNRDWDRDIYRSHLVADGSILL